jgi:hypothetical protein
MSEAIGTGITGRDGLMMVEVQEACPCPFVYAKGKKCTGHIERIEAYKADLTWNRDDDGRWSLSVEPRSHYHLCCSEKGNHAGYNKPDSDQMKFHYNELPEALRKAIAGARST